MARIRKKKALYEVIGRKRADRDYGQSVEPLKASEQDIEKASVGSSAGSVVPGWPVKPRLVQFIAGRLEISIPYQLMIVLALGIVLMGILSFRLGQINAVADKATVELPIRSETPMPAKKSVSNKEFARNEQPKSDLTAGAKGKNVIVIATSSRRSDLEPVRNYYTAYGVATEIIAYGGGFQLWTKNKFKNPGKRGTDGYDMLERIKKLGSSYKATSSFGQRPFQDAYGKKVD